MTTKRLEINEYSHSIGVLTYAIKTMQFVSLHSDNNSTYVEVEDKFNRLNKNIKRDLLINLSSQSEYDSFQSLIESKT